MARAATNARDIVAYSLNRAAAARRAGDLYWARFWIADARRMRRATASK
jgi:hypothetical protein